MGSSSAENSQEVKLFNVPLDSQKQPVVSACVDVFKRAVFKIAVALERANIVSRENVNARSIAIREIEADVTDSITFKVNTNPFKQRGINNLYSANELMDADQTMFQDDS